MASLVVAKIKYNSLIRMKQRKKIVPNANTQLHTLCLHVSRPITMNGKINNAFWNQIVEPYNQNHLVGLI